MIIDLILDRQYNDSLILQGYTHIKDGMTGKLKPLAYDPRNFYRDVLCYGEIGKEITLAMDYGTEEDIKYDLKRYVLSNEYSSSIFDYINYKN